MKMFKIGDTDIRVSAITAVQRQLHVGKLLIFTPDKPGGIVSSYKSEKELNAVYDALMEAIEEE